MTKEDFFKEYGNPEEDEYSKYNMKFKQNLKLVLDLEHAQLHSVCKSSLTLMGAVLMTDNRILTREVALDHAKLLKSVIDKKTDNK